MIRFNTYQYSVYHKNMNWVGKYTFGSVFFRGTRIHLTEKCGVYLNDSDLESSSDDIEYNIEEPLKEEIMFRLRVQLENGEFVVSRPPLILLDTRRSTLNQPTNDHDDIEDFHWILYGIASYVIK